MQKFLNVGFNLLGGIRADGSCLVRIVLGVRWSRVGRVEVVPPGFVLGLRLRVVLPLFSDLG